MFPSLFDSPSITSCAADETAAAAGACPMMDGQEEAFLLTHADMRPMHPATITSV